MGPPFSRSQVWLFSIINHVLLGENSELLRRSRRLMVRHVALIELQTLLNFRRKRFVVSNRHETESFPCRFNSALELSGFCVSRCKGIQNLRILSSREL